MHSNNSEKAEEVQGEQDQNNIEKEDPNNLDNLHPQEEEPKEEFESQEENKKIFVKNVPYSTTDEQFQEFFSKFGSIVKAEIRKRENGASMGIGFVEFASIDDKRNVMTASKEELILDGRELDVREARIDTGLDSKTIYVGNISAKTDADLLRKFFMDFCPNLKGNFKVNVKTNSFNGGQKGYAYIEFENDEDIANALKANGEKLDDKELIVQMKRPRAQRRPFRGGRFPNNMGGRRGGYGRRFDYGGRDRERDRDRDRERENNYRDYRDRGRERSRSHERSRDRERRRDRGERDRDRGREREGYYRMRNERDRDRDRERMDRERMDRDRIRDRERDRPNRDRDRDRDRNDRDRRNMHIDRNQV
jgi:RNA recognition motif-containing protein